MGLGKTLSIVSLMASTRDSGIAWSKKPLDVETETPVKPELSADGFKNRVFGMPDVDTSKDKKRKCEDRTSRIKYRARGTLLVCPMSTLSNWTQQLTDHWGGRITIVGGSHGVAPKEYWANEPRERDDEEDDFDMLRVYVYHGPARVADPEFLAHFDIVLTSYNVLALEYSKMCSSLAETPADTPTSEQGNELDAQDLDGRLSKKMKKNSGKAPTRTEASALQSVEWFRVVLDEAQ